HQRPDARQHLLEMERFCHIVVGAGVEALHLVAPAVARGEDQHRHDPSGAAPRLQDRNAVHLGKADIQDDGIIGLGITEKMALLAVEGAVHHIAGITQRGGELAIEIGVILDHEEAHLWFSSLPQSAASMCHRGSMENKTFFPCEFVRKTLRWFTRIFTARYNCESALELCVIAEQKARKVIGGVAPRGSGGAVGTANISFFAESVSEQLHSPSRLANVL